MLPHNSHNVHPEIWEALLEARMWSIRCQRIGLLHFDGDTNLVTNCVENDSMIGKIGKIATYYILLSGFIGNPQVSLRLALQTWRIMKEDYAPFLASYVSLRSGCEGHDGHVCYLGPQLWVSPSHAPDLTIVRPNCSNWSGKFRYQAISVWIITSWPAPYLLFVLFLSCASSWVILIYHVCCTATPSSILPRNWLNPSFRPLQNFQFLHLSESETLALGEELSLNLSAYFPAPSNIWIFDFRHPLLHISPLSQLLARQKQWQFGATRFGPSDHKKWVATNDLVGRAMVCVANTLERSACASSLLESFLPSSQRGPKEAKRQHA